MRVFLIIGTLFFFTSTFSFGQSKKHIAVKLGVVTPDEFPVKIDGGCSFFTYDSLSLEEDKYALVVDAHLNGFVKINNEIVFFGNTGRIFNKNGYVHKFSFRDYHITLDLRKGEKLRQFYQFQGTLDLTVKGQTQQFRIHGVNEETLPDKR